MSIVNLRCSNHDLTLASTPILASGSQNVDTISVQFDETWDIYGVKEAIFWKATTPNLAYRQIFENYGSTVVIPANVLNEKGNVIFCLRGVNGDDIITTTIVTLDIVEGVAVEGVDPSVEPSVYDEILKELQNIRLTCGEQIIEQNEKHAIKFWVGTQAQYDALETKPTDTLCIVTDGTAEADFAAALEKLSNDVKALGNVVAKKEIGTRLWSGDVDTWNAAYPPRITDHDASISEYEMLYVVVGGSARKITGAQTADTVATFDKIGITLTRKPSSSNANIWGGSSVTLTEWDKSSTDWTHGKVRSIFVNFTLTSSAIGIDGVTVQEMPFNGSGTTSIFAGLHIYEIYGVSKTVGEG